MADQACKNCGEEIAPRWVKAGGPAGMLQDGFVHKATGLVACAEGDTVAEVE